MRINYILLADLVVLLHFAFVLFVILGGFLILKWKRIAWFHIPSALWAVLIEFFGWICPLTPLEIFLREKGGEMAYSMGFIEHYILPWIYPSTLTRPLQIVLGLIVLVVNFGIYGWFFNRRYLQFQPHRNSSWNRKN